MKISQEKMLEYFLPKVEKEGKRYKKNTLIKAKLAPKGMEVVTETSDGIKTKNIAEEGDYFVENQTSTSEMYLVRKNVFERKYQITQSLSEGWATYQLREFIWAIQITAEDIQKFGAEDVLDFTAPWGELSIAKPEDFLVLPPEKDEIYRIAHKEFKETYKEI
ncbi:hypothetical protein [Algoriphagus hitonicola]|uniref:Uncharacterized protein n=1 Tax=Algoriphagus hitonicola TaxID=435880 RepID=A0A1I2RSX1_9BACT|nr:hypothetical protein [Algoriphagus hitonicola]SFG40846.1 hypothetical protein SAMN04487988_103286 [Algoriphagus hitonicola]